MRTAKTIETPGFDEEHYVRLCPEARNYRGGALRHYLEVGWRSGLNPSAGFDTRAYLVQNPDVQAANVNPLEHYLKHGLSEGRSLRSPVDNAKIAYEGAKAASFPHGYWFVVPSRIEGHELILDCWAVDQYMTTGDFYLTIDDEVMTPLRPPMLAGDILSQRLSSRFGQCAYFQVAYHLRGQGQAEIRCHRQRDGTQLSGVFRFNYSNGALASRYATAEQITRANRSSSLVHAFSGYDDYRKLKEIFERFPTVGTNLLDWGIGNARVAQYFLSDSEYQIFGCDIDPVNTKALWDAGYDEERIRLMEPGGPIPFADETFDCVYGISVFTHLTSFYQDMYLAELRRVLKPGGTAIFSIHGAIHLHVRLDAPELFHSTTEEGIFVLGENSDLSNGFVRTEKERLYVDTLHSAQYISSHWGKFFDHIEILPAVPIYQHDFVICRKV